MLRQIKSFWGRRTIVEWLQNYIYCGSLKFADNQEKQKCMIPEQISGRPEKRMVGQKKLLSGQEKWLDYQGKYLWIIEKSARTKCWAPVSNWSTVMKNIKQARKISGEPEKVSYGPGKISGGSGKIHGGPVKIWARKNTRRARKDDCTINVLGQTVLRGWEKLLDGRETTFTVGH